MPKRTEAPARVPGAMAPMYTDAALQSLFILQAVDNSTDVAEDAVELAQSVNVIVYALVGIPVYQGSGLAVIYTEALLDGLLVVVAAPALLAAQYEVRSIAFPSISTGAFGFPIERAARLAIDAVKGFVVENRGIKEVRFVVFSAHDLAIYRRLLKDT